MIELILQGMGVGVALAAPIGPINIEIVRRGLRGGFRAGWMVGLGAVTADTIYCTLVVSGLTPFADRLSLRMVLFLAGAVVLAYLGYSGIRVAMTPVVEQGPAPVARHSYATGFMMAVANPYGIIYWLSIGGALVASAVHRSGWVGAPALVGGVFLGIVCWVTFLSGLTQGGRRFVSERVLRWLTALGGLVLIGFAISFAVAGLRIFAGR